MAQVATTWEMRVMGPSEGGSFRSIGTSDGFEPGSGDNRHRSGPSWFGSGFGGSGRT